MLGTICIILAVIGLIVVILALLPGTAGIMPANAFYGGIVLLVLGVILYVVLLLVARSPSPEPTYGMVVSSHAAGI